MAWAEGLSAEAGTRQREEDITLVEEGQGGENGTTVCTTDDIPMNRLVSVRPSLNPFVRLEANLGLLL